MDSTNGKNDAQGKFGVDTISLNLYIAITLGVVNSAGRVSDF